MPWGKYLINGYEVYAPDEEVWSEIVIGDALSGEQKRSPYRELTWTRQVADDCTLSGGNKDWFTYDNTTLASITTRTYKSTLDDFTTYASAVCKSVDVRMRHGVGNQIVAVFWVDVGSAT
jgi:hypothetical protein